ncbi:MAG: endonuclease domain-containing protein [Deltaproteobacteria bacterium]|jgi:very-short-patch-repair endonuclease|nr:endonuclease domain-containing protein [Deltaproteobacteria bacterium]
MRPSIEHSSRIKAVLYPPNRRIEEVLRAFRPKGAEDEVVEVILEDLALVAKQSLESLASFLVWEWPYWYGPHLTRESSHLGKGRNKLPNKAPSKIQSPTPNKTPNKNQSQAPIKAPSRTSGQAPIKDPIIAQGQAQPITRRHDETPFKQDEFQADTHQQPYNLADILAGEVAVRSLDKKWLSRAQSSVTNGCTPPFFPEITLEIQARQLSLALGKSVGSIHVMVRTQLLKFGGEIAFSKGVEWLARETGLDVLVFLPRERRVGPGSAGLEGRGFDDEQDVSKQDVGKQDAGRKDVARRDASSPNSAAKKDGVDIICRSLPGSVEYYSPPSGSFSPVAGQGFKKFEVDQESFSSSEDNSAGSVSSSFIEPVDGSRDIRLDFNDGVDSGDNDDFAESGNSDDKKSALLKVPSFSSSSSSKARNRSKTDSKASAFPQPGEPHPKSPLEKKLYACINSDKDLSGLFLLNQPIKVGEGFLVVDFYWPKGALIVEVDGYFWHKSAKAFIEDRHRDYLLILAGKTVLRLAGQEVDRDVDRAMEKIRNMVGFISKRQGLMSQA